MAIALRFRDAVCLVGRFPVLAGVTCEVNEGEVVHLRGPNGAGKTSFLRACAGLTPITAGEAVVLGYDLRSEREDLRREIGLFGAVACLYEELTVEENLRFFVRASHRPVRGFEEIFERLGLSERLRKSRTSQLSTGQRRRAEFAVFLARAPRLWLLDEPHAGLDAGGRDLLDELIGEAAARGETVLFSSHELERARTVADRTIEIDGGAVVQTTRLQSTQSGGESPPSGSGSRGRVVA